MRAPSLYKRVRDRSALIDLVADAAMEELVGPAQALDAARLVTAWATGFISMELAGPFRLEGDLERPSIMD